MSISAAKCSVYGNLCGSTPFGGSPQRTFEELQFLEFAKKKNPVGTVVQERRSIVFLENGMRIATLTFSFLHIFLHEFVKIYS